MTKELAIRILAGDVLGTTEQTQEAVIMAVRALSQPDVADINVEDLISRQDAIDAITMLLEQSEDDEHDKIWNNAIRGSINEVKRHVPSAQPEPKWIPVKMRPMDSEEREYWENQIGEKLEDEDAVLFDCEMPEDRQEILVSYRKWICMDKCEIDGGCYGLEGNGDWEGVIAWMPLPGPYETDG